MLPKRSGLCTPRSRTWAARSYSSTGVKAATGQSSSSGLTRRSAKFARDAGRNDQTHVLPQGVHERTARPKLVASKGRWRAHRGGRGGRWDPALQWEVEIEVHEPSLLQFRNRRKECVHGGGCRRQTTERRRKTTRQRSSTRTSLVLGTESGRRGERGGGGRLRETRMTMDANGTRRPGILARDRVSARRHHCAV